MIIGVKSPEINTLDSPSHGYTPMWLLRMEQWYPCQVRKQMPVANDLVHSWFTPGALLVHSWCTLHFWCTLGALQRFPERELLRFRKEALILRLETFGSFLLTYKPEREWHLFRKEASILRTETFWIVFPLICKPERELHRFRKEVSILRSETFGSSFANLQTRKGIALLPKGSLDPPHRTFGSPKTLPHSSPKEA